MPLVPGICPQCGGELLVNNEQEAAVCKYCGTPFIVEKAITTYNNYIQNNVNVSNSAVNITGQQVSVYMGDKNLQALIERGKTFADVAQFGFNTHNDELSDISVDILNISDCFEGHYYAYLAEEGNIETCFEKAKTQEQINTLAQVAINKVKFDFSLLLKANENPGNAMLKLSVDGYDICRSVELESIKRHYDNISEDNKKEYNQLILDLDKNMLCIYKEVNKFVCDFYFSENSVTEYEYKCKMSNTFANLALLYDKIKEYLTNKNQLKEYAKKTYQILENSKDILLKEMIFARAIVKNAAKLAGIDTNATFLTSTTNSYEVYIAGKKGSYVSLGLDYILIQRKGFEEIKVYAKDVVTINGGYLYVPSTQYSIEHRETQYWLVYRVGDNKVSAVKFAMEEPPFGSSELSFAIITWTTTNDINYGHEKWYDTCPFVNGYNGRVFVDPYKREVNQVTGKSAQQEEKTLQNKNKALRALIITAGVLSVKYV